MSTARVANRPKVVILAMYQHVALVAVLIVVAVVGVVVVVIQ